MAKAPKKTPGVMRQPYTNATANDSPAGGQIGLALLGRVDSNAPTCPSTK